MRQGTCITRDFSTKDLLVVADERPLVGCFKADVQTSESICGEC